ncbi:MAG: histidine triad nucleotide-binding protein [Candidatus Lindowbacteria bacterium]|nr:histidine triad nucleotide-binding protein [Candidatus Lindowbacteria bacterium]
MSNCIFCKIADGEIPADKVYEDASILAFKDIQPQAPLHIVIIPKKHIETLNDVSETDARLLSDLVFTCQKLAKEQKIAEKGYRVVVNCNRDGGQAVFHLHAHLLGGRKMSWPPG